MDMTIRADRCKGGAVEGYGAASPGPAVAPSRETGDAPARGSGRAVPGPYSPLYPAAILRRGEACLARRGREAAPESR